MARRATTSRAKPAPAVDVVDDLFGPEYGVVRLRPSWAALASLCLMVSLTARFWVRLMPSMPGWRRPFLTVLVVVVASLVGTIAGWLAHRVRPGGYAKLVLGLNVLALVLAGLAVAFVSIILGNR